MICENDCMGPLLQQTVVARKGVSLLDRSSRSQQYVDMGGRKQKNGPRPVWAERLTAMRVLTGATQTGFAKSIGLSQQRYGKYETGGAEPDVATWLLIADKLDTSVDFIMRGPVTGNDAKGAKTSKAA